MVDKKRKSEAPEIPAISEEEISKILASFGAWADREDITDDWLDNLRSGWEQRLKELYSDDITKE